MRLTQKELTFLLEQTMHQAAFLNSLEPLDVRTQGNKDYELKFLSNLYNKLQKELHERVA